LTGGRLKWADYGISRALFAKGLVEKVEVRADPGARMGDRELWSREQVVAALVLGAKVVTMRPVNAGGWVKIDDIKLVKVEDELFVRVSDENVAEDDLGNLDY
jgi:hypothetical protein